MLSGTLNIINDSGSNIGKSVQDVLKKKKGAKKMVDSEAVIDKLRQDENGSLELSVNPQQLRRQTAAVVNVDVLGTSGERQRT